MIEKIKIVIVIKKIALVLIVSILLSCKGVKFVTYQKPMSNLELGRYIRLIEQKKYLSLQNYLYIYNAQRNFDRWRYPIASYNINNFSPNYRNYSTINIPQTGTTGNTLTTPNVQPPISNGNIKTKQ